jgi:paraquat-inducible protein B
MDDQPRPAAPQPEIVSRRRARISLVWLVPIVASLIALSIFFERAAHEGPEIVITFKSAHGIEPGKTPVRYKDVQIGVVTAVELSSDLRSAEVTARITRKAAPLMTHGASFWIVRPRVGMTEISGLGTLFSGHFIAFERGEPDRPERRFAGLDNAMVVAADTPGRRFVLRSRDSLRIDAGLPVYYLGLQVGEVISSDVAPGGRGVDVIVFVNAPYERYVRESTRFWNASGIDLGVRGGDISLRTESVLAMLVGGIAFEDSEPGAAQLAGQAADGASFALFRDRDTALEPDDSKAPRYALFFDEPLEGVQRGTPVTLLGVAAGKVKDVSLAYDDRSGRVRGRLEITFAPESVLREGNPDLHAVDGRAFVRSMVARRGLRAQLRTANLLTGQRYVAFDYFSNVPVVQVDWTARMPALPAVPSLMPALEAKLQHLLEKLDTLPVAEALADARSMMREAQGAFAGMKALAADVDRDAVPAFVSTMEDARRSLASAQRMMDNASETLVGPDAPGQQALRAALVEIARAAKSMRTLADTLERNPQSVIWGKPRSADSPKTESYRATSDSFDSHAPAAKEDAWK